MAVLICFIVKLYKYCCSVVEVFRIYLEFLIKILLLRVVLLDDLLKIIELFIRIVRWKSFDVFGEVSNVNLDVLLEFCLIRVIEFGLFLNFFMFFCIYFNVNI